jgi:hypothetical protein
VTVTGRERGREEMQSVRKKGRGEATESLSERGRESESSINERGHTGKAERERERVNEGTRTVTGERKGVRG